MSTSTLQGKYRLAVQSGTKGYFGEIILDVEHGGPSSDIEIEFDPVHASQWQIGARFGLEYVLEHGPRRILFPEGGRIHVSRIEGHPVDTSNAVVAYVAALALVDALGVSPRKMPQLDAENALLVFPK